MEAAVSRCTRIVLDYYEVTFDQRHEIFEIACAISDMCTGIKYWGKTFDVVECEKLEMRLFDVMNSFKSITHEEED